MAVKNNCVICSRIYENKFREIVKYFTVDINAVSRCIYFTHVRTGRRIFVPDNIATDGMVDTRSIRYRHFRRPWRSANNCSRHYLHFHRPWRSANNCSRHYLHFHRPWRSANNCSRHYLHFHRPWRSRPVRKACVKTCLHCTPRKVSSGATMESVMCAKYCWGC